MRIVCLRAGKTSPRRQQLNGDLEERGAAMGGFPSRENKLWVEYLRFSKAARVARAERVRGERQENQVSASARWHRDAQTGGWDLF